MTIEVDRRALATLRVCLPDADEDKGIAVRRNRLHNHDGFFGDVGTVDGKLRLVDHVLRDRIAVADRLVREALGVVMGDAVAQQKAMTCYMLALDGGRTPCIGLPGTPLKIPTVALTTETRARGEPVKARNMFDDLCRMVDEWKAELQSAPGVAGLT
ncbi:MAG: hypothetical protein WDN06_21430 [Asticcacaulis sp.]